jgi:site-specific recombinase XerD
MQLQLAFRLLQEACALRHLALNTQKTYAHWLGRYGSFLKDPKLKFLTPEQKLQAFLTRLALSGLSASSQNQAFNALLFFYRDVLKAQLGPVDSLRAKRPAALRHCPDREDVFKLLAHMPDIY